MKGFDRRGASLLKIAISLIAGIPTAENWRPAIQFFQPCEMLGAGTNGELFQTVSNDAHTRENRFQNPLRRQISAHR